MTALLVAVIVWGIVAFMATDDYCRTHETKALRFLVGIGLILTLVGAWSLELADIKRVPFSDWLLIGLFPIVLVHLRLKTQLVKLQSQDQGFATFRAYLDLSAIPERSLVKKFRVVSAIMWGWAVATLIAQVWSRSGITI